jgi:cyanophycinase
MSKGYLVLIGGGEDCALIFNRMFDLAGGKENSRIAIIPSASSHPGSTMHDYEEYFVKDLGLDEKNVWSVPLAISDDPETLNVNEESWKNNAWEYEIVQKIKEYNIVFFVGGDQRKYIDLLRKNNIESPLLRAIEELYIDGAIIGGTSAGTNVLCKKSVAGGISEDGLMNRIAYRNEDDDEHKLLILNGLGLVDNIILDSHYETRGRMGRLVDTAVLTQNKYGIGISERTAVILTPENTIEVIGFGDVIFADLTKAQVINKLNEPLHVRDVSINLFTHGDKYEMASGKFTPYEKKVNIMNTPYFDANDYYISLNVFKDHETSHIMINYLLDNEAKDVIAISDYDKQYRPGDVSSFVRYVETDKTESWFCKMVFENENEQLNNYSGINVSLDIIPLKFIGEGLRAKNFNAVIFGVKEDLLVVVFDNVATMPVVDAKVFVYDAEGKLIFKKGSDRYGRSFIRKTTKDGGKYTVRIAYDGEEKSTAFTFTPDMEGICLY